MEGFLYVSVMWICWKCFVPFRTARDWRGSRICESKVLFPGWVLGKRFMAYFRI